MLLPIVIVYLILFVTKTRTCLKAQAHEPLRTRYHRLCALDFPGRSSGQSGITSLCQSKQEEVVTATVDAGHDWMRCMTLLFRPYVPYVIRESIKTNQAKYSTFRRGLIAAFARFTSQADIVRVREAVDCKIPLYLDSLTGCTRSRTSMSC